MSENVSAEFLLRIAHYADLPLPADRAETVGRFLGPALRKLRAIRPDGYEHVPPAFNLHLPLPPETPPEK
jgi:hypothetical protein